MRDVLALIVCGNRICEVIAATLGPLPLDQLQKSKPVTPYAVFTDDTATPGTGNRPIAWRSSASRTTCGGPGAFLPGDEGAKTRSRDEKPLRALAVAEDAPAGA